jgi:hypothetical protein
MKTGIRSGPRSVNVTVVTNGISSRGFYLGYLQEEEITGTVTHPYGPMDPKSPERYYISVMVAAAVAFIILLMLSSCRYGWCSPEPVPQEPNPDKGIFAVLESGM